PQAGRDRPEWVVAINRNAWSQSIGTAGRDQSERPVAIARYAQVGDGNEHQDRRAHALRSGGDQISCGVADDEADGSGHHAYLNRLQEHADIRRLAEKCLIGDRESRRIQAVQKQQNDRYAKYAYPPVSANLGDGLRAWTFTPNFIIPDT
ncbi:hypothetical protein, partial [Bradyrhizobium algeriense]|uniref:hypothetical protein n=1 Tax=Bradyrhizobium algeriense TaxID=634784 RepID=UPI001AECD947